MELNEQEPRMPTEVKVIVAVTLVAAIADDLFGGSPVQLAVARIAFAAGLLRGLEPFRQLLRVTSIFAVFAVVGALAHGAWVAATGGLVAAMLTFVMLGSPAVRAWCGAARDRDALSNRDDP